MTVGYKFLARKDTTFVEMYRLFSDFFSKRGVFLLKSAQNGLVRAEK
jgi:hypothetical protein